jgi:hypothetical protein
MVYEDGLFELSIDPLRINWTIPLRFLLLFLNLNSFYCFFLMHGILVVVLLRYYHLSKFSYITLIYCFSYVL